VHKEKNPKNAVSGMYYGARTFGSDLYNGVTGVVVDPYRGAKQGGAKGMIKGVGKGIIGLFFKPIAGTCSLIQYTSNGILNTPGTIVRGARNMGKKKHKLDMPEEDEEAKIEEPEQLLQKEEINPNEPEE
jgi:hypothetical protein